MTADRKGNPQITFRVDPEVMEELKHRAAAGPGRAGGVALYVRNLVHEHLGIPLPPQYGEGDPEDTWGCPKCGQESRLIFASCPRCWTRNPEARTEDGLGWYIPRDPATVARMKERTRILLRLYTGRAEHGLGHPTADSPFNSSAGEPLRVAVSDPSPPRGCPREFAVSSLAELEAYIARKAGNPPTFTPWLKQQAKRHDPIGDLARDTAPDPDWPKRGGRSAYVEYLEDRRAADNVLDALRDAWDEWSGLVTGAGTGEPARET